MSATLLAAVMWWWMSGQPASPLLDYQEMQALRERVAALLVEVEVVLRVPAGADPSLATRLVGQGACVADGFGRPHLVTSQFLVDNAASVRVRCRLTPEWADAHVARMDRETGLAELKVRKTGALGCMISEYAPDNLADSGVAVVSVDDPVSPAANVFWGFVEGRGEPPLASFLLTSTGLPLGYPLYSISGRLVALNLRSYAAGSKLNLAATAGQVRRMFALVRRDPQAGERRSRRPPAAAGAGRDATRLREGPPAEPGSNRE